MKITEKMKRFFTLNAARSEGFTLVELIVVIAILAILAGVAIPAYSGYIEKSKTAADDTLLNAVNKAFASACAINGKDHYQQPNAEINLVAQGDGMVVDSLYIDGMTSEAFTADFMSFFADNEDAAFQVYKDLKYDSLLGGFKLASAAEIIANLKEIIDKSNFNGKLDLVVGQVDGLTSALSGYLGQNFSSLAGGGFDTYLTELGIGADEYDKQAEAAILYLSKNAAQMNSEDVKNVSNSMNELLEVIWTGEGDQLEYINKLTQNTGSNLASYAALYAVAEGIALEQGEDSEAYKALHDPSVTLTDQASVLAAVGKSLGSVSEKDMIKYMTNSTESDINAYITALQTINGNQAALESEVKNGDSVVDSAAIQDILAQLNGK